MKLTEQELQALARCVAVARASQSILLGATAKERNEVRDTADEAMTKLRTAPLP